MTVMRFMAPVILFASFAAAQPTTQNFVRVSPRDPHYFELTDGILLHDMLFAPFFSGAAGTGHVWWWVQAIDKPNLWHHFARFAKAVEGIDPPAQDFTPVRIDHPRLRIHALEGKSTILAWCRDAKNDWRSEFIDHQRPELLRGQAIELNKFGSATRDASIRIYDPWADKWTDGTVAAGQIALPDFRRSIVVRIQVLHPSGTRPPQR